MLLFPYFVRLCEPICNFGVEFVDGSDLKVVYKTTRAELVDLCKSGMLDAVCED